MGRNKGLEPIANPSSSSVDLVQEMVDSKTQELLVVPAAQSKEIYHISLFIPTFFSGFGARLMLSASLVGVVWKGSGVVENGRTRSIGGRY